MRSLVILGLGALAFLVWVACSSDIHRSSTRTSRSVPVRYDNPGFGLDPGPLNHPITARALAGASIPGAGGGADVQVAFVAFATKTHAKNVDPSRPADDNGAEDIFVAAVVNDSKLIQGQKFAAGFREDIVDVFRDQRCTRCHGFFEPGGFLQDPLHIGKGTSNSECTECHETSEILDPRLAEPAVLDWIAPSGLDLRGQTDLELYQRALDGRPSAEDHLRGDDKIQWAIQHARVPFQGVAEGGPVPVSLDDWKDMIDAWALGGFQFTSGVQDVVLASQVDIAPMAGNAASLDPSVAFEPNPGFDPSNPVAPAGWVYVAFASDATNLVSGAVITNRDVYRVRLAVHIDVTSGAVDLRFDVDTRLVSESTAAGMGGNGDSGAPAISADGTKVAFASLATDLVPSFVEGNEDTESDVFLRDVTARATALASSAKGSGGTQGGDGSSHDPVINSTGAVVAFESLATDLVAGDTNGVQDVFYVHDKGAGLVAKRASVGRGGAQASGGASRKPSVWLDPVLDEVWVAFESRKADLESAVAAPPLPPAPALGRETFVYLHQSGVGGAPSLTTRISRPSSAASRDPVIAPDGSRVVFVSKADDLDAIRKDENGVDDVYAFDLAGFRNTGQVAHKRLSLNASGRDGDGPSTSPALVGLRNNSGFFEEDLLLGFSTEAKNLGRTASTDVILQFLKDPRKLPTVAEFWASGRDGILPLTVEFRDLSTNATSWLWSFGDGETSTEQNPTHTYTAKGEYPVTLTVTGSKGQGTNTKDKFVVAVDKKPWAEIFRDNFELTCNTSGCHGGASPPDMPNADEAYDNLVGTAPDGVESQNCPGKLVVPGDAQSSLLFRSLLPESDPRFPSCLPEPGRMGNLTAAQIREVQVWIDDGALKDGFVADFTASASVGASPLTVSFTNRSSSSVTAWQWDFGVGTSAEENPPPVTYPGGTYTVSLTVTGPNGETDTVSQIIEITEAKFTTTSPTAIVKGGAVTFLDQSEPLGKVKWDWNFGDPGSSMNTSSAANPTHQYGAGGNYNVTLKATGPGNTESTLVETDFVHVTSADFTSTNNIGSPGQVVRFTDASQNPGTYLWDFGDPTSGPLNSSNLASPTHTYANAGSYDVKLTVTVPGGTTETEEEKRGFVNIGSINFGTTSTSNPQGAAPHTVEFEDRTVPANQVTKRTWDFGDGTSGVVAFGPTISHPYTAGGVFDVTLTVEATFAPQGISLTQRMFVQVTEAKFMSSPASPTVCQPITFDATTSEAASSFSWTFSGSARCPPTTASGVQVTKEYCDPGTFGVTLQATGPAPTNAVSTKTIQITVADKTGAKTWANIATLISNDCARCHGNTTFELTYPTLISNYVTPCDSANSLLVQVMNGMYQPPYYRYHPTFSTTDVESWIDAGAQGPPPPR